jgi:beta-lactam-binding protein with PASTA domain
MPSPSEDRSGPARAEPTDEGVPRGAGTRPEQQPDLPDPGPLGDIATELLLAVCEADEAGVRRVLDRCPDLLHLQTSQLGLDGKDNTPLHIAASCGHTAVVRLLVERGASALCRDVDGDTPFNRAVLAMQWEVAEYLASVGGASAETERDRNCLTAYDAHTSEALGTPQLGGVEGLTHRRARANWGCTVERVERLARAFAARMRAELSLGYRGIRRPALTEPSGSVSPVVSPRSAVAAGVLGVLLGGLGAHRFYLGFWVLGALQLLVTVLTWSVFPLGAIWGAAEGVLILLGRLSLDAGGRSVDDPGFAEAVRRVCSALGHAGKRLGERICRLPTTLRNGQRSQDRLLRPLLHTLRNVPARVTVGVALLVLLSTGGLVARRALAPSLISMPKLTGLSESAAVRTAPEELRLQVAGEEHAPQPCGTVLRQEPAPGERVAKGGAVRIWVSLGPARPASSVVQPIDRPQTARVPEVVDLPVASAREALAQAGLLCTVAGYEFDRSHPEGTVIRQVPPAGPAPSAPTQVEVVVSKGWQVQVPSVTGLTQRVATERLRERGLVVTVASRRDGRIARGLAVGSTPPAGRTVEPGSRVTLIISAGKPPAPSPGYGTLSVSAEPQGCEVWVYVDGGAARGTCPLTVRLAPGDHAVTLWDTSHEPGVQQDLRVEIADGTTTKLHRRMH